MPPKKKEPVDLSDAEESEESGTESDEVANTKISKEFQENVVKYVKLDDLIKKKQGEMSELKKQKKPCEDFIIKYMEKVDQHEIGITDGKLKKDKVERKENMNSDLIKATLIDKLKDPKLVEEIIKSIDESRPIVKKVNIKRTSTVARKPKAAKN